MLARIWTAGVKVKGCSCCVKQYDSSYRKLNTELPHAPAIPLLGLYPTELKAGS